MRRMCSCVAASLVSTVAAAAILSVLSGGLAPSQSTNRDPVVDNSVQLISQGRQIFRFDTFGDEAFWGDTLHLNQAIAGRRWVGSAPVSVLERPLPPG